MGYAKFDLTGHVSLVTGGNSGIGLGMARGLVEAGAQVCIWGTKADRNAEVVESLGERASAMRVDVGEEESVVEALAEVVGRFGRLDSCFANAGVESNRKPLVETSLADFRRITRINLDGAFVTLREAARHMIELGNGGSLVATSSLSVLMGQAGGYAYTASKGGLVTIVKALAVELARHGIRANALLPGWTESGVTAGSFANEKFVSNVMPRMPVRRWGVGDDFGGIAVYLASEASSFHTGDSILIDGGYAAF
ncbi:SDR family oxidoreductase [Pseudonocardia eucalypti]|uniref:SDR family oxidoreductase n=1 Tax=Pseudonocardia eucalypti TaxID=648755 RepID=A0ABP9R9C8_9PSEU|nr:NAD(P)-dependent dehydrogenase (short-subunit alcohol dehydrogenase family) [Pseudonocardia eucalypti]